MSFAPPRRFLVGQPVCRVRTQCGERNVRRAGIGLLGHGVIFVRGPGATATRRRPAPIENAGRNPQRQKGLAMRRVLAALLVLAAQAGAAERDYDIVVYGGTPGGISAAVQAVRLGKSVVLIEPGKYLGGMTTGGLGATDIGNKGAIGGISREVYQRVSKYDADDAHWTRERRGHFKAGG